MATKPFPVEQEEQTAAAVDAGLRTAGQRRVDVPAAQTQADADRAERRLTGRAAPLRHGILAVRNRLGAHLLRAGLEHPGFTVLSNDCWGQALYEGYGLPCQTPLAGAGMYADCFLRFLCDIEGYLRSPLHFVPETRYAALGRIRSQRGTQNGRWPVALLGGDVEVHFLHYRTEEQSRRAWNAGCERLNLQRIAVKLSADKDGVTRSHVERFAAMPFERKLVISRHALPEIACALHTPDYVINGAVMFRRSAKYFDCTHWLNTGEILRHSPRVLACKALFARGV